MENLLSPAGRSVRFVDLLRAEAYGNMFTGLAPDMVKQNLLALAASPRFRDLAVRDYLSLFDTCLLYTSRRPLRQRPCP